ncbi:hypothetical protein [Prolixibacter bellariivorans]|uniref:hypothetical protein n=1 Tax=Prolixibacter bellariivorans TaxID=314319 RepID=UPI001F221159|nr:hypothetical protein [Prolixibacter bellariivorans]
MSIFNIYGMHITASTTPPARREYPELTTPNNGTTYFATAGTITNTPHTPYTTEGMPAKISITGSITCNKRCFPNWVR